MTREEEFGRLAFRVEGEFWNAYLADKDSMLGAILLGSIRMSLVRSDPRKQEFLKLMQRCFSDQVEKLTGQRPLWRKPVPGPEHERTRE